MRPDGRRLSALALVALTTMMGVHALRAFLAMIVWNIGVERPALVLGGIALAVYAAGLAGWIAAPRLDTSRAASRLAVVFAAAYALTHYIRQPLLTPALALATAVAWLWYLPALIGQLSRRNLITALAPGILAGFAAQVALQAALHGLDLAMLRGIVPGLGATLLAAALLLTWRSLDTFRGRDGEPTRWLPGWGLAAFGPYLVLQLTLLSNAGRAQMLTGAPLPIASLPALLGLAVGAAAIATVASPRLRIACAAIGVVILLQPAWLERQSIALLLVAQIALSITLAEAVRPDMVGGTSATYGAGAAGLLLAFVVMFVYYSRYEAPALWPVLAALVAIPALLRRAPTRPTGSMAGAIAVITAGLLGVAVGSLPSRTAEPTAAAPADLRVLDYNIHMGFDAFGVPDPQDIARTIERADADIVALQEVGRGWTVNGGADLFSWLRWRFPRYRAVYGAMNGALWGNAILSRYPISDQGSLRFPIRESVFQRGLTWVTIPTPRGEFLVIATHFASEEEAETDRLGQAGDVLAFWRTRPHTVVMGDFNAGPESAPITRLQAAGLRDALAPRGLGAAPTFPSPNPTVRLDYVFVSADVEPLAGAILRTTASDHLPVVAQIRLR